MSDTVFEDIADAIRTQNGGCEVYEPGEMAQAILDLEFDFGYKCRGNRIWPAPRTDEAPADR